MPCHAHTLAAMFYTKMLVRRREAAAARQKPTKYSAFPPRPAAGRGVSPLPPSPCASAVAGLGLIDTNIAGGAARECVCVCVLSSSSSSLPSSSSPSSPSHCRVVAAALFVHQPKCPRLSRPPAPILSGECLAHSRPSTAVVYSPLAPSRRRRLRSWLLFVCACPPHPLDDEDGGRRTRAPRPFTPRPGGKRGKDDDKGNGGGDDDGDGGGGRTTMRAFPIDPPPPPPTLTTPKPSTQITTTKHQQQ
ncbi:hypothetical protein niasHT_038448 [Heterodera trifolii]|uniref:Uncharacterized protein n=1 Tax=Heterodera trifolii TaxID=157864 RepID=A0ABD2IW28_9BILA